MKAALFLLAIELSLFLFGSFVPRYTSLFNGKNLSGWQGDTAIWRVQNGVILGGSLEKTIDHNYFLVTDKPYKNFVLKAKIKLLGQEGFINSGIQFRSKRLQNPDYEMQGYQADFGAGFWASLYDESRRNKTLIAPDSAQVLTWIKVNQWNSYEIDARGRHIKLTINGHESVNYLEPDTTIIQEGLIGLQIHGGGKAQVHIKDLYIKVLP